MARIGVDMDGVLYNFCDALAAWHYNRTREELPEPTRWHFGEADWGWTDEFFLKTCREASDAKWLYAMGQPIQHAVQCVRILHEFHSVHIVTARTKDVFGDCCEQNTRDWLDTYDVPYDSLTFSKDKTVVDVDFFIDDFAPHVDALRAKGTKAYLLDVFGLQDWPDHPYKVTSWLEFMWNVNNDLREEAA